MLSLCLIFFSIFKLLEKNTHFFQTGEKIKWFTEKSIPNPTRKSKWYIPNLQKSNQESVPPYLLYQVQQQHFR